MSAARRLTFAGGPFARLHRQRIGPLPDLTGLVSDDIAPALLDRARATWRERTLGEFRSIQIATRFLTEVVGAGDPFDVYAGALELVEDEIRHTELCASICALLGAAPSLPDPIELVDPPAFLEAPMAERALTTALCWLGVNETISVGYLADLAARCHNRTTRPVLEMTSADEDHHQEFAWTYLGEALRRAPPSALAGWRQLVEVTLEAHVAEASRALEGVPTDEQRLEAWPEAELAQLGLLSPQRKALVYRRTWLGVLGPRLGGLGLL